MPPPAGFVITPRDQQPIRSANDTDEYRQNYTSAEYVNALYALDNGWTGKGVAVGIMDDGVLENEDLEGAIDTERSRDFGSVTVDGVTTERNVIGDENSNHGTAVAQIIGARRNGFGNQGYAPEVTIVALRIDDYNADEDEEQLAHSVEALRYATDINLQIINRSMGIIGAFRTWQTAVEEYAATGGLIINSTGNDTTVTTVAGDPVEAVNVTDANRDAWLFVTSLNPNGTSYEIAPYANHCGSMMDICVAAPGTNYIYRDFPAFNDNVPFAGTSSAAPVVTALAATILHKWPQLTGQEAGQIILNTARDIGEEGVDEIYGRGLVDFRAALSPVDPMLSNGAKQSSIDNAVMVVGSAFGGGDGGATPFSIDTALSDITVLDAYGRDFNGSVAGLVVRPDASNGHWLRRRLDAQAGAGGTGWITPTTSGTIGYASLPTEHRNSDGSEVLSTRLTNANLRMSIGEGTSVIAGFNSSDNVQQDIMGLAPTSDAMFAHSPLAQTSIGISHEMGDGNLAVIAYAGNQADTQTIGTVVRWQDDIGTFKLGVLDETGAVFGTPVGAGALRFGDGATTMFFEAASGFDAGDWSFDGYASIGATRMKIGDDTLMTDAGMFMSTRFGINVSREALGGRARMGLAQDLVALDAQATYTVGNGYDLANRSLTYGQRNVDFSGRISPKVTFGYERHGERSSLRFGGSTNTSGEDVRALGIWSVRW